MINDPRQAGASNINLWKAPYEFIKAVERFRDDLAQIKKRWDNRLILEKIALWEGYLNGSFEIVLYVNWRIRAKDYRLACRIGVHGAIFSGDHRRGSPAGHIEILDGNNCNCGQNEVMFVDVVQLGHGIKVRVPTRIRFYLVPNECGDGWNGLLYRSITNGGFVILPLTPEWEIDSPVSLNTRRFAHNSGGPVVKRRSEVMEHITDNEREHIRNWLEWFVNQLNTIGISKDRYRATGSDADLIQVLGQGGGQVYKGLNVDLGPFNL